MGHSESKGEANSRSETLSELLDKVEEMNHRLRYQEGGGELEFRLEREVDDSGAFWKQKVTVLAQLNGETERLDYGGFHRVFDVLAEAISRGNTPSGSESEAMQRLKTSDGVQTREESETPATFDELECCICLERKSDVLLPCLHSFCQPCITDWLGGKGLVSLGAGAATSCPTCRAPIRQDRLAEDAWTLVEDRPIEFAWSEVCKHALKK